MEKNIKAIRTMLRSCWRVWDQLGGLGGLFTIPSLKAYRLHSIPRRNLWELFITVVRVQVNDRWKTKQEKIRLHLNLCLFLFWIWQLTKGQYQMKSSAYVFTLLNYSIKLLLEFEDFIGSFILTCTAIKYVWTRIKAKIIDFIWTFS